MLKIYSAYSNSGHIEINDYIDFEEGEFDTGIDGFGIIKSGNLDSKRTNYVLGNLKDYKDYLKNLKIEDGYVKDFILHNPLNNEMLKKYLNTQKEIQIEGLVLFTNWVKLTYSNNDMVERIFGRHPETAMYLIKPNASFIMGTSDSQENYEVLQSQSKGKQLILTKVPKIF